MKNLTCKVRKDDGTIVRKEKELRYQLNYGIADLLNKSVLNEYNLPIHHCDPNVYPDYIALNTEPSKFHLTPATALGFYTYDRTFDKINGLYNAIQYQSNTLLSKYKKMYANIKFVIGPDYSLFDDIWPYENESRLLKIRVIMLWFVMEIGAIVIPNAIYISADKLPQYMSGFETCTTMCFSTKGHIRYADNRKRVKDTVKYAVDHFPLKVILVYSVCGCDSTSLKLFEGDKMIYEKLYDDFTALFPEDNRKFQKLSEKASVEPSDGMHIMFGMVIMPFLFELLETKSNAKLKTAFGFFEQMALSDDSMISEVLEFTVLEELISQKNILNKCKCYMGRETLKSCQIIETYMISN